MFPYLFSVGSEANVKQCVLFVLGRPAVYLLFISIIRNETCTFRISYNNFDVKHNEDNPFVVGTKSMNVTVLGTEFNVSAYSDIEEFNIALLRGSIELNLPDRSRRYRMTAGEQVFYKKGKYVSAQIGNMDYFKWKEGLLCFNNQPIHVIIDKLRLYYDVRIEVADLPFLEERYSGKFRVKEGIEQVLKVLQLEHKFTYVKDNELNLITIK